MSEPQTGSAGAAWTPGSYGLPRAVPEPGVKPQADASTSGAPSSAGQDAPADHHVVEAAAARDPSVAVAAAAVTAQPVTPPAQPVTPPAQPVTPPAQPVTPPATVPAAEGALAPQKLPPPLRPVRAPVQNVPMATATTPVVPPAAPASLPASISPPAAQPVYASRPAHVPPLVFNTTPGGSRLEVVNRDGWRKEFLLRRALAYVGSQPGSDIYLPQPDVAPRHIQFVPSPVNRAGYRAINFSNAPLTLRLANGQIRSVPPRGAAEVADGDAVELAGYALVFRSGEVQSAAIQARVDLAAARLELDKPLEGGLYIRNVGDKAGVQFEVQAQGEGARFVQIEPAPVLFPGAEKRVAFRITHPHQPTPLAGDHTLTFVVTAPAVYPGESAVVSATFTLAPFYAHRVRFVPIAPSMADYTLG